VQESGLRIYDIHEKIWKTNPKVPSSIGELLDAQFLPDAQQLRFATQ
jgi:hypothetical protein